MPHRLISRFLLITGVLSLLVGCGTRTPALAEDVIQVGVSIAPQAFFVQRLGGERVSVTVLAPAGANAHTYEPKPEQLKALSQAQLYFRIGVEFEAAWMDRLTVGRHLRVVDTTQGIALMPMIAGYHQEGEAKDAAHEEGLPDPHIWLSPRLVRVQAQTIHAALVDVDPTHRVDYDENLKQFLDELDALDAELAETLNGLISRQFMVFHPSWGYFARDYDLAMIPIEVGGQEPSAQELAALITAAKAQGIRVVFAQPSLSTRTAETIAREIGGQVVLIDPLAEDWATNLHRVAETLAGALGR
jgi:zinc transport system substrate-binding protein